MDRAYANAGTNDRVLRFSDHAEVQEGRDNWQNEISLDTSEKPAKVQMQFKQPTDGANQFHQTPALDSSKFKDPEQMLQFEAEVRKAAQGQPVNM